MEDNITDPFTKSKSYDSLDTHVSKDRENAHICKNSNTSSNELYKISQTPYNNPINNLFYEKLDKCLGLIKKILLIFLAFENKDLNSFYIRLEFKFSQLNYMYINGLLNCFQGYRNKESHKAESLRIYDFIVYEFSKLRTFYLEATGEYFNLDEELKYCKNIQVIFENDHLLPSRNGKIYLDYLMFYLEKTIRKLENFNNESISKKYIDSYRILNVKIKFLANLLSNYLIISKNSTNLQDQFPSNERWIELLKLTDKKVKY